MGINKDQVEGRFKEVVGTVREQFGKLVGNKAEESKGKVNKSAGAAQANRGDLTEKAKDSNEKP